MSNNSFAEMIHFRCPRCNNDLRVSAQQAGGMINCENCQAVVNAPASSPDVALDLQATTLKWTPSIETSNSSAASMPSASPLAETEKIPIAPTPEIEPLNIEDLNLNLKIPANSTPTNDDLSLQRDDSIQTSDNLTLQRDDSIEPATNNLYKPIIESNQPTTAASSPRAQTRDKFCQRTQKSPRKTALFVGASLVLIIGIVIGIFIYRGSQRAQMQSDVENLLAQAQTAYSANDAASAAKLANDANLIITSNSLASKEEWTTRIQRFNVTQAEIAKLQTLVVNAEKDPGNARSVLEGKRLLLGAVNDANRPIITRIETMLTEVSRLESKKKLEKLRRDQQDADKLYRDGKIENAADRASQIGKDLLAKPPVQDHALESRLETLRKYAETLQAAQADALAANTNKNYVEARAKLQTHLNALDEKKEDLKPLIKRLSELKKNLIEEEKRSNKLTTQEATSLRQLANGFANLDRQLTVKQVEANTIGMTFNGQPLRLGLQRSALNSAPFFEIGGNRLLIDDSALREQKARPMRVLRCAMALGEAMKKAGVASEEPWNAADEAPFVSARRASNDGKEYVFLGDRLYIGSPLPKTDRQKDVENNFAQKGAALEQAIRNDQATSEEIRDIIATAVQASFKKADWHDHLRGDFVRKVINDQYIEKNMPGAAQRLKKELTEYYAAYAEIVNPNPVFSGATSNGDQAVEMRTFDDQAIWTLYDRATDTTTFALKNPDEEKDCLFILYDFPGKLSEFPKTATPKTARMTHQAVGVTATYNFTEQKMTYNKDSWDLAAALELPPWSSDYATASGFNSLAWLLPPHVLLIDLKGDCKSIITPSGKLDIQDFSQIADATQRVKDMDAFLDQMARVLPTTNYLHLYFRYFHEYILDSPITSMPNLLGSRAHCGDIHQTVYESLGRLFGGRYIGDCDDLAELFMTVTRRQGKLSYVMSLPSHAACGWVEKTPNNEYAFSVCDTGLPRMFTDLSLDKVIEKACRAYDQNKTMRFDPKSLGFLFRFNKEQTRTPYWLSSRMYVDKDYGEVMERVQGYWHFHFYALGIKTMTEMITKGDRVPENCIELAGLYGQIRETEDSIKWTNEALKQFGPNDQLSRFNEEFRIGSLWRGEHKNEKAYDAVKNMIGDLKRLEQNQQWFNYTSSRLQLMNLLEAIGRPWDAWSVVARDMNLFHRNDRLHIEHIGGMTNVYQKMRQAVKSGKQLTITERDAQENLAGILAQFYDHAIFAEAEDDFNDYLRKYAFMGKWYAGKYGYDRLVEELLKNGPYPNPSHQRNHRDRKNAEAEDWKWIRLSPISYVLAVGDAIDMDDPPEKWRKTEAIKLIEAMLRAADHARKFGSLAGTEYQIISLRVLRDFLVKDWKDLELALEETKKRNWAQLTTDVAETFGRGARFVTPQEFVDQYKIFTKYIKTRTSYFTVVYEAYRAEAIEHALAATKIVLNCCPGDEDMAREAKYLEQLVRKKQSSKKNIPEIK